MCTLLWTGMWAYMRDLQKDGTQYSWAPVLSLQWNSSNSKGFHPCKLFLKVPLQGVQPVHIPSLWRMRVQGNYAGNKALYSHYQTADKTDEPSVLSLWSAVYSCSITVLFCSMPINIAQHLLVGRRIYYFLWNSKEFFRKAEYNCLSWNMTRIQCLITLICLAL